MAKNPPYDDGHREGAVKDRSQPLILRMIAGIKRDKESSQFIDQKADDKPFKGVRREK